MKLTEQTYRFPNGKAHGNTARLGHDAPALGQFLSVLGRVEAKDLHRPSPG